MFGALPIGQKLFLLNALSGIFVLVVAGSLLIVRNHTTLEENFHGRIQQEAELVAANATAAVLFEDWDVAGEVAAALFRDSAVTGVRLATAAGAEVVRLDRGADAPEPSIAKRALVMDGDRAVASITVLATDAELWVASRSALGAILAITFAVSFVAVVISHRVQRRVTAPISNLSEVIRDIRESSRYSLRGEVVYPDEVGRLTQDVNAMLEIIEARDRDLERQVAERTQALSEEMAERRKADLARAESQKRFEQAFEHAPVGMGIIGADAQLLQRNRTLTRIFEVEPTARLRLTDLFDEVDLEQLEASLADMVSGEASVLELELQCRTMSGKVMFVEASLAAIRDQDEQFLYAVLQLKDVTDARQLARELEHQAAHDVLTGLANRRTLRKELEAANDACAESGGGESGPGESGQTYSLAILDLDQFKVVNDTSGHAAGDSLLIQVSHILKEAVRPEDTVVRLGGDEFALLMRGCPEHKAFEIANTIRETIEAFVFHWDGVTHRIGVSIGIVCVTKVAGGVSDVMQRADAACFAAKELGRNQVHLVTDSSEAVEERRGELHWVHRLHTAMDRDEFLLYVQPVMPLKGDEATERLEVLLRLRNFANDRMVPPGAFLPSAERYGLSVNIDRWVVGTLLKTAEVYRDLFEERRTYWVNLTGSSFGDPAFTEFLVRSMQDTTLPRGSINFEITETAVVRNIKEASLLMEELRQLGCRFALDDFGKGLSSFGYLKSLPVDLLKIDGMFIRDMEHDEIDRMFVKSIIDIAQAMNMKTVAEFIENDTILDLLKAMGADYGQGYHLGRPRPLLPQGVSQGAPVIQPAAKR